MGVKGAPGVIGRVLGMWSEGSTWCHWEGAEHVGVKGAPGVIGRVLGMWSEGRQERSRLKGALIPGAQAVIMGGGGGGGGGGIGGGGGGGHGA